MRLDAFLEDFERDEAAERRRLAQERSYAITEHLEDFERRFDEVVDDDTVFGSTAPSIFVGHADYPQVPTGVLSPVGNEERATDFVTTSDWYHRDYSIADVFQRRSGLLTANRRMDVETPATDASNRLPAVHDRWEGFVGVQREVAIADEPVDLEIGLADTPTLDVSVDEILEPSGPWAAAESADLTENPSVPIEVEKTLADDDWRAEGAMTYLYRRGYDVYEIHGILSAGALGEASQRRLVPTRWSITAVDDTVGEYLRGRVTTNKPLAHVEVWANEFLGNRYWIVLAPGHWEYELLELKGAGSVWNPAGESAVHVGADYEGATGRSGYVDETAGAYHAARLGVLEHLDRRGRQAKALVIRHVTDEYWGPVGVWQVRESVRNAFADEPGRAASFDDALGEIVDYLPVSSDRVRRASELAAGRQRSLAAFEA